MTTTQTTPDLSISTAEHPNATRMREAFDAFSRGDLENVHQHMTDTCTWTNYGTSPLAGTYSGWDEISAMFVQLFTLTEGTFTIALKSVFADDARSVACYDGTVTLNGQTQTLPWILADEVDADGKVTATNCFCYDQDAADAMFAGKS